MKEAESKALDACENYRNTFWME